MNLVSESETVILDGRGGIRLLYVIALLLFLLAGAFGVGFALVFAGVGDLDRVSSTSIEKSSFIICLIFVAMGVGCCLIARQYSKIYVKIGPEGVRFRVLRQFGFSWKLLPERSFTWDQISGIGCNSYSRYCEFTAGGQKITLNSFDSPSPVEVAELMAKRKGVRLAILPMRTGWY